MFGASSEVVISVLNWTAPCLYKQAVLEASAQLLGCLSQQQQSSISVVMCPVFSYKKNSLWMADNASAKMLVTHGMVVDRQFSLLFERRTDWL